MVIVFGKDNKLTVEVDIKKEILERIPTIIICLVVFVGLAFLSSCFGKPIDDLKDKQVVEKNQTIENQKVSVEITSLVVSPYEGLEIETNISNNTNETITYVSLDLVCIDKNFNKTLYLFDGISDNPIENITTSFGIFDEIKPLQSINNYFVNYDGFWKVKNGQYVSKKILPANNVECDVVVDDVQTDKEFKLKK